MRVYSPQGAFLDFITTAEDRQIKREICVLPVFKFYINREQQALLPLDGRIDAPLGSFIIKEKKKTGERYEIVAKPDISTLQQDLVTKAYITKTVTEMGADLLAGTGWTIASTATERRSVTLNEQTRYAGLYAIVDRFKYEIDWNIASKIVTIQERVGRPSAGLYIHDQVNLREITTSSDSYDLITRLIPRGKDGVGIESINGGVPYLENLTYSNQIKTVLWTDERYLVLENLKADGRKKLDDLARPFQSFEVDIIDLAKLDPTAWAAQAFGIGDTVDLISTREGIDEQQRIVEWTEHLDEQGTDTITIANVLRDYMTKIEEDIDDLHVATDITRASIKLLDEGITLRVTNIVTNAIAPLEDEIAAAAEEAANATADAASAASDAAAAAAAASAAQGTANASTTAANDANAAANAAATAASNAQTGASAAATAAQAAHDEADAASAAAAASQTKANQAAAAAQAAQGTADGASGSAGAAAASAQAAQDEATAAATAALTAQTKANAADAAAAAALDKANTAQTTATNAGTAAANAQTKANTATTNAATAQTTANNAAAAAAAAQTAATTADAKAVAAAIAAAAADAKAAAAQASIVGINTSLANLDDGLDKRDIKIVDTRMNGVRIAYDSLMAQINNVPSTEALTAAVTANNTANASLLVIYNSAIADGVVTDQEWVDLEIAVDLYQLTSADVEEAMAQAINTELGTLASSITNVLLELDADSIMSKVTGTETWKNTASSIPTADSIGTLIDTKILTYDTTATQTRDAFERTITEAIAENADLIETKTRYFREDIEGLHIGLAESPFSTRINEDMLAFMEGDTAAAWVQRNNMYIEHVVATTSLTVGKHRLEAWDNNVTLGRWIGGT